MSQFMIRGRCWCYDVQYHPKFRRMIVIIYT
nr:MAG TPA: hypothetical protein [Caudoviricetes sp.]DAK84225.1 MAG TPA: hypothetical protein [Caudoviricetes sp.]